MTLKYNCNLHIVNNESQLSCTLVSHISIERIQMERQNNNLKVSYSRGFLSDILKAIFSFSAMSCSIIFSERTSFST